MTVSKGKGRMRYNEGEEGGKYHCSAELRKDPGGDNEC